MLGEGTAGINVDAIYTGFEGLEVRISLKTPPTTYRLNLKAATADKMKCRMLVHVDWFISDKYSAALYAGENETC